MLSNVHPPMVMVKLLVNHSTILSRYVIGQKFHVKDRDFECEMDFQ
jgi:hypothetical protein